MERKFENLSDTQLEEMLEEARTTINQLEEEQIFRVDKEKRSAWADLVDEIKEFCEKYGAITVEGMYNYDRCCIDIYPESMDSSTFGFISTMGC